MAVMGDLGKRILGLSFGFGSGKMYSGDEQRSADRSTSSRTQGMCKKCALNNEGRRRSTSEIQKIDCTRKEYLDLSLSRGVLSILIWKFLASTLNTSGVKHPSGSIRNKTVLKESRRLASRGRFIHGCMLLKPECEGNALIRFQLLSSDVRIIFSASQNLCHIEQVSDYWGDNGQE